ncbi:MAG: alpha-galactosidase [Candidatus Glassbacteria bacterium]|nr:alpha-galactosidase [Candidatus Glassbacteria bacterium]
MKILNVATLIMLQVAVLVPAIAVFAGESGEAVSFSRDPDRWTINTRSTTHQIVLGRDGDLAAGYFGPLSGTRVFGYPEYDNPPVIGTIHREIPYRGGFMEDDPLLEVVFADGVRELELVCTGHETGELDGCPYLRLDMKDTHYPFNVSEYIRVIPELDIYEKWLVLSNTGAEDILLENAGSGSVQLPAGAYDLIQFGGGWGREFLRQRTRLTIGTKTLSARTMKSYEHLPFFLVRPMGDNDEMSGPVWFGAIAWSGNYSLDFYISPNNRLQIKGGINFWDTHWNLKAGESFTTPKMVFGYSDNGPGGASLRMHRYMLDYVLPQPNASIPSKVLYNSWYATTFNINEKQQIVLARQAARLGVELFVVDDAWFRGRNDDRGGLGDWEPDPVKFPRGLGPLIKEVKSLGMDFGIWVEPEMVNANSDLYRSHPEWVLQTQHRRAHEHRNQLILNMARDDVKEFTIAWLDRLLSENEIDFIKWDMNRSVSEAGWPGENPATARELRIRYVQNLREVFAAIRGRHPGITIENCAGGGGRVNIGLLELTDQVWTSDNTDPGDRMHIQYGYSHALPAKTMVNWVTDEEWHNKTTPLKFRFQVAMAGNLGIGGDITSWSEEDKALASEMVALYKDLRPTIQFGDQYRLRDPFEESRMAVQFVSRDRKSSVLFTFQTLETLPGADGGYSLSDRLVLQGLDPDAVYRVKTDQGVSKARGEFLMAGGLSLPLRGNYSGAIAVLEMVE